MKYTKTYLGMALLIGAWGGWVLWPEHAALWERIETVGLAIGGIGLAHKTIRVARTRKLNA